MKNRIRAPSLLHYGMTGVLSTVREGAGGKAHGNKTTNSFYEGGNDLCNEQKVKS